MTPARTAFAAALVLLAAGCSGAADSDPKSINEPSETASVHQEHDTTPVVAKPLRKGERFLDLKMPTAYTPAAPYGEGTDDYRCFLLDPKLTGNEFLTGIDVRPGNADVVHHVILFQVPPSDIGAAEDADAASEGEGWTCFGGAGLRTRDATLDNAPWIGAWAPGGGEQVNQAGVGIPMANGARVIMQVHYNLLAGKDPDRSGARLRLAPGNSGLDALETVLLPAPVELPCREGKTGELCDRSKAMADVRRRFGTTAGAFGDLLHFLCGPIKAGPVQSCTREAEEKMTIRAAAGHMHLLGREISIAVNGKKILDIPVWDFDDQGSDPVGPIKVKPGDEITVTCRHDQSLRDLLPSFRGQEERYVVWGEGTTDEMCLGVLLVTKP